MTRDRHSETVISNDHDTSIAKPKTSLVNSDRSPVVLQRTENAVAVLRTYPTQDFDKFDKSEAIDHAYEQYCQELETGRAVNMSSFCERFPSICHSLYRQIEVEEYLRHNSLPFETEIVWPEPGDELSEFLVVQELGRGAFARAYLCAEFGVGNRHVVVKYSRHGAFEAETMGRLTHPNIMHVFSVKKDDTTGSSLICMPFVGRSTLCDVLDMAFQSGKAPRSAEVIRQASVRLVEEHDRYQSITPPVKLPDEASYVDAILSIGIQLADALQHAHKNRIIHGDLKPSNIVLSLDGTPMIVDFNLSNDDEMESTIAGGTLPYMAPEQIDSVLIKRRAAKSAVTPQSDIFSLGAVLYELFTGKLPFGRPAENVDNQRQMATTAMESQLKSPRPAHTINNDVPITISELIQRCLAYEPNNRPLSIAQLVTELNDIQCVSAKKKRSVGRRKFLARVLVAGVPPTVGLAWLKMWPLDVARNISMAKSRIRNREYLEAIGLLDAALVKNPTDSTAIIMPAQAAAAAFEQTKDQLALTSALETFRSMHGGSAGLDLTEWLAYCQLQLNNPDAARNLLDAVNTPTSSMHNNLGCCFRQMARWSLAQKQIAIVDKSAQDFHLKQAEAYCRDAHKQFRQAVSLNPDLFVAQLNLTLLYDSPIRSELSVDELYTVAEKAVSLNNNSSLAQKMAATLACEKWNVTQPGLDEVFLRFQVINDHIAGAIKNGCRTSEFIGHPLFKTFLRHPKALDVTTVRVAQSHAFHRESVFAIPLFVFE